MRGAEGVSAPVFREIPDPVVVSTPTPGVSLKLANTRIDALRPELQRSVALSQHLGRPHPHPTHEAPAAIAVWTVGLGVKSWAGVSPSEADTWPMASAVKFWSCWFGVSGLAPGLVCEKGLLAESQSSIGVIDFLWLFEAWYVSLLMILQDE